MIRREIHAEVVVDAPPEHVWRVLTDLEGHARWNPFMRDVRGEVRPGAALSVRIDLAGRLDRTFAPRIVTVTPLRELTWIGRMVLPGLFDGEHSFFLEPQDEGRGCLLIQHENFSGLLMPLFTPELEAATRQGFEAMNDALKREAERLAVMH